MMLRAIGIVISIKSGTGTSVLTSPLLAIDPTGDAAMLQKFFFTLALLAAATATAEARYACAVKSTPDGFVALREGPSIRTKMIARMRPQELVNIMHPDTEDLKRSGEWLWARWYPGTRRTADHTPTGDERTMRSGWVHDKFINCFEE